MPGPVRCQRGCFGGGPVRGVPHVHAARRGQAVTGDDVARPADRELAAVDRHTGFDELAEAVGWDRVTGAVPGDERQRPVHPPGLDVVGVEPASGQRLQEASLDVEPFGWRDSGRTVRAGMHPIRDPQPRSLVELLDRVGQTRDDELLEERLLQVPERPLDLAFAFRVTGLTRLDLHT